MVNYVPDHVVIPPAGGPTLPEDDPDPFSGKRPSTRISLKDERRFHRWTPWRTVQYHRTDGPSTARRVYLSEEEIRSEHVDIRALCDGIYDRETRKRARTYNYFARRLGLQELTVYLPDDPEQVSWDFANNRAKINKRYKWLIKHLRKLNGLPVDRVCEHCGVHEPNDSGWVCYISDVDEDDRLDRVSIYLVACKTCYLRWSQLDLAFDDVHLGGAESNSELRGLVWQRFRKKEPMWFLENQYRLQCLECGATPDTYRGWTRKSKSPMRGRSAHTPMSRIEGWCRKCNRKLNGGT